MNDTGSIGYSLSKAKEFTRLAQKNLNLFPDSPARQHLLILSDFVISRDM